MINPLMKKSIISASIALVGSLVFGYAAEAQDVSSKVVLANLDRYNADVDLDQLDLADNIDLDEGTLDLGDDFDLAENFDVGDLGVDTEHFDLGGFDDFGGYDGAGDIDVGDFGGGYIGDDDLGDFGGADDFDFGGGDDFDGDDDF